MAKTKPVGKTQDQRRAERAERQQQNTLDYARDQFVVDKKGNVQVADPGPSIFDT